MAPERQRKHVQRTIRSIPVEQVAPTIAAEEQATKGTWCIVANELQLVPADGSLCITQWEDAVEYALIARYVQAHPERVHGSHEEAVAFVRSRFALRDGA